MEVARERPAAAIDDEMTSYKDVNSVRRGFPGIKELIVSYITPRSDGRYRVYSQPVVGQAHGKG